MFSKIVLKNGFQKPELNRTFVDFLFGSIFLPPKRKKKRVVWKLRAYLVFLKTIFCFKNKNKENIFGSLILVKNKENTNKNMFQSVIKKKKKIKVFKEHQNSVLCVFKNRSQE